MMHHQGTAYPCCLRVQRFGLVALWVEDSLPASTVSIACVFTSARGPV